MRKKKTCCPCPALVFVTSPSEQPVPVVTPNGVGDKPMSVKAISIGEVCQPLWVSPQFSKEGGFGQIFTSSHEDKSRSEGLKNWRYKPLKFLAPHCSIHPTQTLSEQTTRLDVPGHQTTRLDVPGHQTTRLDVPGHQTTRLDVPGHQTTRLDVTGHQTTGLDVTGHQTTGLDVFGPDQWLDIATPFLSCLNTSHGETTPNTSHGETTPNTSHGETTPTKSSGVTKILVADTPEVDYGLKMRQRQLKYKNGS